MDLSEGVKTIGLKWIFINKCNADGTISKSKSRFLTKIYIYIYINHRQLSDFYIKKQ